MPEPQSAINFVNRAAAIFLTLLAKRDAQSLAQIRDVCGRLDALVRAVGARDSTTDVPAVISFGYEVWEPLFGLPRPTELHPFIELNGTPHHAPSTPGDIFVHIQSDRPDLAFELAAQVMAAFGSSVTALDELHGFRYFDDRDLIGFVDGTENPRNEERALATIVGDEDPAFAGGSYVITEKYLHNLPKWHTQSTETQEGIIGRTKVDDIELDDAAKPSFAHNVLNKVVVDGAEVPILRHNMPFGNASGENGTFFIAYARSAATIEQMLANMFFGSPPGNYDRLLDFTTAVTGSNFYAPSMDFLAALQPPPEAPAPAAVLSARSRPPRPRLQTTNGARPTGHAGHR